MHTYTNIITVLQKKCTVNHIQNICNFLNNFQELSIYGYNSNKKEYRPLRTYNIIHYNRNTCDDRLLINKNGDNTNTMPKILIIAHK